MAAIGTTTKHMLTYVNNVSRNKASLICIIPLLLLSSSTTANIDNATFSKYR